MTLSTCELRKSVVLQTTFIVDCSLFIKMFTKSLFFEVCIASVKIVSGKR